MALVMEAIQLTVSAAMAAPLTDDRRPAAPEG